MKVSELRIALERIETEHGDVEVRVLEIEEHGYPRKSDVERAFVEMYPIPRALIQI